MTFRLLSVLLFCLLWISSTVLAEVTPEQFDSAHKVLVKYCVACHSAEKKEGELDLSLFDTLEKAQANQKIWDTVMGRVLAREMPPEGSRQPNDKERGALNGWLRLMVKDDGSCDKIASDRNTNFYRGHVMSRRLSRTEYSNSIRDLLGVDIGAAERLPSDGSGGEGFDTVGDSLFLSPIHLEKYLETAELVTTRLFPEHPAAKEPEALKHRRAGLLASLNRSGMSPHEAARSTLKPLIRRAFRRPVTDEELDRYLSLSDQAIERGDAQVPAFSLALQGVLISPHFLFLAEPEPEKEGVYPLADHPLAARLAMFLWSSLPDEALLDAADAGKLQNDDELRRQVQRMLRDPRAQALGDNFAMQWLGLNPLGTTVRPDAKKFPEFTDELATAMRAETAAFFTHLFTDNRSLLELLDSDYTFLNEALAKHYGIQDVSGPEIRRVSLSDRNRGGVLTHASVLTVSSFPLRTSPVLRGRWVLEEILGSRVPPPPPDVPALKAEGDDGVVLSLREQLEKHRKDPQCASCHARMDPLGFGFENYDPIGRWRTEDGGHVLDTSGKLPSGEKFSGPAELKTILLKRKNEVLRHLARKMYGYAVGRSLNKFDDCVTKEAVAALEKNGYRAPVLVEHIVLSYQFRHRYCKK